MIPRLDQQKFERVAAGAGLPGAEFGSLGPVLDTVLTIMDPLAERAEMPQPLRAAASADDSLPAADDPLNAFVRRCEVTPTGSGLLNGVKVAVKDAVAVAGVPLTGGSSLIRDLVPAEHSTVARRILAAGGTVVGLTNMDAFGFSGGGDSSSFGPTLNPHDANRTAGGSSSGSAAALHYPDVDVSIGADQGGSIRIPASWCGVIGLKPTHGLIPYTGITGIDPTFDHVGPMARTVEDVARVLTVLAGQDGLDPRQAGADGDLWGKTRDYLHAVDTAPANLQGIRLGIVEEASGIDVVVPEVDETFRRTCALLSEAGAELERVSVPAHVELRPVAFAGFVEGMAALLNGGGNGFHWRGRYTPEFAAALRSGLATRADQLSPQVQVAVILGEWLRQNYRGELYARAQNERARLRELYSAPFDSVDFLIMPTTPGLPLPLAPEMNVSERVLRGWEVLSNTSPTNMTGHPAITLPIETAGGLPTGTMLIGKHGSEEALLAVARSIEKSVGLRGTFQATNTPR